jgi:hypothetical protein
MHDTSASSSGSAQAHAPVGTDQNWVTVAILDPATLIQARVNSGPPAAAE